MASGMIGGMTAGAVNGAGMTALAGGNGNDILSGMVQGSVIGGFSGFASGFAHYGTQDILQQVELFRSSNNLINIGKELLGEDPLRNTISYLSASSASTMTANLVAGRPIFQDISNVWKDPGILIPLFADFGPRFSSVRDRIHQKNLLELQENPDITLSQFASTKTELLSNGNLNLESLYSGKIPATISYKVFGRTYYKDISMLNTWYFNSIFIPNYSSIIQLYTTKYK